ncbi:LacI family DNA-binding transcriptional regulator [Sphingomonas sp. TDK1]|uniref:LacI family DNA-binding transcriptional regulator n=1 Tax=Sphingomonas sp. TDK1 TaxID=453247 RepID=UPI0007D9DF6B|nr:LacI family DNA-binding transcriptional regulator [Sphingomonas sp. TDK1]OAN58516.1 sugar-binding protein [Sphingomonas sp. TDK1]
MVVRKKNNGTRSLVTAHDVAREAGVSQSAVSRAFTPGASVASGTRAKILAAAERLGYQPNLIARSLISGRSNIVGIGVGNLRNPFFAEALELFSHALERAGYRLLLFPIDLSTTLNAEIQEVLHYRLDALILLSATLTSALAAQCRRAQVPVILFNRRSDDPEVSSVVGNNIVGARTLAAFLHAGGHARIAIMGGIAGSSTSREREHGFLSYFEEHGLPKPIEERGDFQHDPATAATRRLLTRADRPDAIFCCNDHMAIAALNVARFEFGLEPGRDISIVGFDDVPIAAWPAFSLTTFAQPVATMVDRTIDIIRELRDEPERITHSVVEGTLVVRSSARSPRIG